MGHGLPQRTTNSAIILLDSQVPIFFDESNIPGKSIFHIMNPHAKSINEEQPRPLQGQLQGGAPGGALGRRDG